MTWHQIRSFSHKRRILGGAYADRIMALGPIAYWPLDELSGPTARCLVNSAQNAAVTGITWANDNTGPFGTPAPYFDGTNDYVALCTATLDAALNGATGTALLWARVATGAWTDGTLRYPLILKDDADNGYVFYKHTVNNRIDAVMEAGAGTAVISKTSYSESGWFLLAQTWSDADNADEAKYFVAGAQAGSTSSALNAWDGGGLLASATVLGASSTAPGSPWHGWLAHLAIFNYVLPPATILGLAS